MRRTFLALSCMFALCCTPGQAVAFDLKNRADFLGGNFGDLAYAGTTPRDRDLREVKWMGGCETLDNGRKHQFLIGHRNPDRAGTAGYFLVEVLLVKKQSEDLPIEFVEMYRNGKPVAEEWFTPKHELGPTQIEGPDAATQFFKLHEDPNGLAKMPDSYRQWHGVTNKDGKSSFEQSRPLIKIRSDKDDKDVPSGLQRYKYRLLRVTASDSHYSSRIPWFSFDAMDSDLAFIRVSAPEFNMEPSVHRISDDRERTCPRPRRSWNRCRTAPSRPSRR